MADRDRDWLDEALRRYNGAHSLFCAKVLDDDSEGNIVVSTEELEAAADALRTLIVDEMREMAVDCMRRFAVEEAAYISRQGTPAAVSPPDYHEIANRVLAERLRGAARHTYSRDEVRQMLIDAVGPYDLEWAAEERADAILAEHDARREADKPE